MGGVMGWGFRGERLDRQCRAFGGRCVVLMYVQPSERLAVTDDYVTQVQASSCATMCFFCAMVTMQSFKKRTLEHCLFALTPRLITQRLLLPSFPVRWTAFFACLQKSRTWNHTYTVQWMLPSTCTSFVSAVLRTICGTVIFKMIIHKPTSVTATMCCCLLC